MKVVGNDKDGSGSPFVLGLLAALLVTLGLFVWLANLRPQGAESGHGLGDTAAQTAEATEPPTPSPEQTATAEAGKDATAVATGTARPTHPATPAAQPVTTVPPPPTCGYCQHNLVGKTAEEIGQFAVQYVQQNGYVRSGTPQVLLSRSITRQEYTAHGLGCFPDFGTIEQPPRVLVILKGDFEVCAFPIRCSSISEPGAITYVGYVFDLWAGQPTSLQISSSGGAFRTALGDPSLPTPQVQEPTVCPTDVPASQKTLHYGEPAPGFTTPPPLPTHIRPVTATPLTGSPPPTP